MAMRFLDPIRQESIGFTHRGGGVYEFLNKNRQMAKVLHLLADRLFQGGLSTRDE